MAEWTIANIGGVVYNDGMARRWTEVEAHKMRRELYNLYVRKNWTIREIGSILGIAESTVFQRLERLGIQSTPELKRTYAARRRSDITIPKHYSLRLAEFLGIMYGDGSLSYYQIIVTLGTKELDYANYVLDLMENLFGARPKIGIRKTGYRDVYIGSREISDWLKDQGLAYNKVRAQVDIPKWIFKKKKYMEGFTRGFFDTDGSVYRLRFGIQVSFTNFSAPLLNSLRRILIALDYHPSRISQKRLYVTRRDTVIKFFKEIKPVNRKHQRRFRNIMRVMARNETILQ